MSNALALAAVTAVLRDMLDTGLIDHRVTDALGAGVMVSAVAPDTIELTGDDARPRLNLFLHQVTPNIGWRNVDLPSRDGRGRRTTNPPLALDLHYLLTAYGLVDLQAEILLGYAMQVLHETPVLGRSAIRTALEPTTVDSSLLPTTFQALRASALADQVEQIKITPATMGGEEMSRLWSALQAHYRPTTPYLVTVALIEGGQGGRSAPPVLSRGLRDPVTQLEAGVQVTADMLPPIPQITAVTMPDTQSPNARLGDKVVLTGHHLDGTNRAARLINQRTRTDLTIGATAAGGYGRMEFVLPSTPAALPAGSYLVSGLVQRPGEPAPRPTNELSLTLAPEITTALPVSVARDGDGTAVITLSCRPTVLPGQRARLLLGDRDVGAEPFGLPTTSLTFRVTNAATGTFLTRLRVDGIDSEVIDRTATPPGFFNHRITIT